MDTFCNGLVLIGITVLIAAIGLPMLAFAWLLATVALALRETFR